MKIKTEHKPLFIVAILSFAVIIALYLTRDNTTQESSFSLFGSRTKVAKPNRAVVVRAAGGPNYDLCISICTSGGNSESFCADYCAPFSTLDGPPDEGIKGRV